MDKTATTAEPSTSARTTTGKKETRSIGIQARATWGMVTRPTQTSWHITCYYPNIRTHVNKTPKKYQPATSGRYKAGVGTQYNVPCRSIRTQIPKLGIPPPDWVKRSKRGVEVGTNTEPYGSEVKRHAGSTSEEDAGKDGWVHVQPGELTESSPKERPGGSTSAVDTSTDGWEKINPTDITTEDEEVAELMPTPAAPPQDTVFKVPPIPQPQRPPTPGASLEALFSAREATIKQKNTPIGGMGDAAMGSDLDPPGSLGMPAQCEPLLADKTVAAPPPANEDVLEIQDVPGALGAFTLLDIPSNTETSTCTEPVNNSEDSGTIELSSEEAHLPGFFHPQLTGFTSNSSTSLVRLTEELLEAINDY